MGLAEAFRICMRKYADFGGRARRSEFWWFYLVWTLIPWPLAIVGLIISLVASKAVTVHGGGTWFDSLTRAGEAGGIRLLVPVVIGTLTDVALFVPFLAVWVRRLHDMGQSGHWLWLNLAEWGIVPLIMSTLDSQPRSNRWGDDPKAGERHPIGQYLAAAPRPLTYESPAAPPRQDH
jgi:uncharacterized membrane protein YhaH (DUF805 family)